MQMFIFRCNERILLVVEKDEDSARDKLAEFLEQFPVGIAPYDEWHLDRMGVKHFDGVYSL